MEEQDFCHNVRKYCMEKRLSTFGGRGRTDKRTYVCWSTYVTIVSNSDVAPNVAGLGYWKTGFNNGLGFSKTLYTPSTFHIVVGENWEV